MFLAPCQVRAVSLTHSFPFSLSPGCLSLNFPSPTPTSLSHLEGIWSGCVTPSLLWDSLCLNWKSDFSAFQLTLFGRGKVKQETIILLCRLYCRMFYGWLLHLYELRPSFECHSSMHDHSGICILDNLHSQTTLQPLLRTS